MAIRNRIRDIGPDVQMAIAQLFENNLTAPKMLTELQKYPDFEGRIPSLRSLQRQLKDMRKKVAATPEFDRLLDKPFEWHRLEQYGLPWESGSYLLGIWKVYQEFKTPKSRPGPNARQARWCWRVHLADSDLKITDVYVLAGGFSARELGNFLVGIPDDMTDIEAILAYRPWRDESSWNAWLKAIKEGRIPGPKGLDEDIIEKHMVGVSFPHSTGALFTIFHGYAPEHYMPRLRWLNK